MIKVKANEIIKNCLIEFDNKKVKAFYYVFIIFVLLKGLQFIFRKLSWF